MRRLVAICTVVCALSAVAIVPAGASAQSLNSGITAVPVGTSVVVKQIGAIKFNTGMGSLECFPFAMTGTVATNGPSTVKIELTKASIGTCPDGFYGGPWSGTFDLPTCLRTPDSSGTWNIRYEACSAAGNTARLKMFNANMNVLCDYRALPRVIGNVNTEPLVGQLKGEYNVGNSTGLCYKGPTLEGQLEMETASGADLKFVP